MSTITRTVTVDDLVNQPLLYLPMAWVSSYPPSYVAEYRQIGPGVLELRLVDPTTSARAKRYKVVNHNSACWTSIPKPWLRDRSAKAGDEILMTQTSPDTYSLHFIKGPSHV